MLILDTNHFSELDRDSAVSVRLQERLRTAVEDCGISVVTVEEAAKGWLGDLNRPQRDRGVHAYARFLRGMQSFGNWLNPSMD